MRIVIIRHGESYNNIQGKIMSATDLPLTEKGIKQSEAAKEYLSELGLNYFHHVFSSHLIRAKQTAAIICGNEKRIIECPDLREMDIGKLEGLTWIERDTLYPEIDIENALSSAILPEGETFDNIHFRCNYFIKNSFNRVKINENVLIVSHGITIRVLINCLLNKADKCVNYINWADNTAISEIELLPDNNSLIRLNDMSHLIYSGLKTENYESWGLFSTTDYVAV